MDIADLLYVLAAILAVGIATAILVAWLTVHRKHHRHRKISASKRRHDTKHISSKRKMRPRSRSGPDPDADTAVTRVFGSTCSAT